MCAVAVAAPWLSIVGIGEDGWDALTPAARAAVERADVVVGGARHLALIPRGAAERIEWPSPMMPFVRELATAYRGRDVCVLASGDPMLHGVGAAFASLLRSGEYRVFPAVSAFALACARLGWPAADVTLVSAVTRSPQELLPHVYPQRNIVVYSQDGTTPAKIAALLREHGYGASVLHVFERLGGPLETMRTANARAWDPARCDDLNLIAVACVSDYDAPPLSLVPGLPDDVYEHDGAITKREVRAAALARLGPRPGELLWDVGAGSGSIAIEWMRSHPSCRAIAFERDSVRAERITRNARHLGVPSLLLVTGSAPESLAGADRPNAVFIGGGITTPGLIEMCWNRLTNGGRLVANAVTVEGEDVLVDRHRRAGGELVRLSLSQLGGIGSFHAWRPHLPITQWSIVKAASAE
jgi:precorrin-6Y C5,15-methyltransferase (decarboxylating)